MIIYIKSVSINQINHRKMYTLLPLLLLISPILGHVLTNHCPAFNPPQNAFNISSYLGTWYEIARAPGIFEDGLDCVNSTYSLQQGGSLYIENRGYNFNTDYHFNGHGIAVPSSQSNLYYWNFFKYAPKAPYFIATPDLVDDGLSVVISCLEIPFKSLKAGFILARKKQIDNVTKHLLIDILIGYGFNPNEIRSTEQIKCAK